jgi:hypothetical protein
VERGRQRLDGTVRRYTRRENEHFREAEPVAGGDSRGQVAAMDWVERAAEDADASMIEDRD